ncbi:MAG: hypothetical protein WD512_14900 [Candidatus Paceibacterota bacterium]
MSTNILSKNFNLIKNKNLFDITKSRISAGHNGNSVIIPHVCNNVNAFGAGFAGQVSYLYPEVKANFHLLGNKSKLGHVQFIVAETDDKYKHQIVFGNMIAQNRLISSQNMRPLNYGALVYSMTQVRNYIKDLEKNTDSRQVEIHAPKFGSGLAGGNWNFITDLIQDIWYDIPVFIYSYK